MELRELTYTLANKIAGKCRYLEHMACTVRNKYRDCDRPLCCGFCPTVDDCGDVCALIIQQLIEGNDGKDN